jgi:hypothetical protein
VQAAGDDSCLQRFRLSLVTVMQKSCAAAGFIAARIKNQKGLPFSPNYLPSQAENTFKSP